MMNLIEKEYENKDLNIKMKPSIDNKNNVWFIGKQVAEILGYKNTKYAILEHVSEKYKMLGVVNRDPK